jgi:hypothetical protein
MNITQQKIKEINKTIDNNYKVVDFVGGLYTTFKDSKCIVFCKQHGLSSDWGNPWNPNIGTLKNGNGCPKCANQYKQTEEEILTDLKKIINPNISIIKFVNNEYKNVNSRVIVKCKIHGEGKEWGTPWTPKVMQLKLGYGCPKCGGGYKPTKEEVINTINEKHKDKFEIAGFINNEYKNRNSKAIINCKIHGLSNEWENPWFPKIRNINEGGGCPRCANESNELNKIIKKEKHFKTERVLYFITFKNLKNNSLFYKIGVAKKRFDNDCIEKRFSNCNLKKDNIKIIKYKKLSFKNILVLLSEYWILRKYKEYKKPMFHILKANDGGSECFGADITKIMPLNKMIKEACLNYKHILNDFNLTTEEYNNAEKEIQKILKEENFTF